MLVIFSVTAVAALALIAMNSALAFVAARSGNQAGALFDACWKPVAIPVWCVSICLGLVLLAYNQLGTGGWASVASVAVVVGESTSLVLRLACLRLARARRS